MAGLVVVSGATSVAGLAVVSSAVSAVVESDAAAYIAASVL